MSRRIHSDDYGEQGLQSGPKPLALGLATCVIRWLTSAIRIQSFITESPGPMVTDFLPAGFCEGNVE